MHLPCHISPGINTHTNKNRQGFGWKMRRLKWLNNIDAIVDYIVLHG